MPTIWLSLIQAYERALAEQPGRWKLPEGMRSLVGGAAVPEALIRAFARHGIGILQGWGMTETSPLATVVVPARASCAAPATTSASAAPRWPACRCRWSTCGIRGDDGASALGRQERWARSRCAGRSSPALPRGAGRPTDKFTDDGWLRTGDVAAIDALGFVRITDRTKDLIKSGGEWISSVDLENALMAHPADRRGGGDRDSATRSGASGRWPASSFKPGAATRRLADGARRAPAARTASPSGSCPTATR